MSEINEQYDAFLDSKLRKPEAVGFDVAEDAINGKLFPFQRKIVQWACKRGRAACFADTGLGKTLIELEFARLVYQHMNRPVLILCPLAVAPQTKRHAEQFEIDAPVKVCREASDVEPGINLLNYERLHKIDPSVFAGLAADESGILKNFIGKTKRLLLSMFADTPYKLAASATPAPNDHLELGNHAEFLNVMPSNEMISRWFINDTMAAGNYRLRRHAAKDFWRWVSSWALCVTTPGDIGYPDDGFILPPLRRQLHTVDCKPPKGMLFHVDDLSATDMHREMRQTAAARAECVAGLVKADKTNGQWLLWCHTDYEADALLACLPDAIEVRGSHKLEVKEERLFDFATGKIQHLITKPKIAGYGMNFQSCCQIAFVGLTYSFESVYQATRRCWRFGQKKPVDVHIVASESEGSILATIERKESDFLTMKQAMQNAVRENQMEELFGKRKLRKPDAVRNESGESWTCYLGDAVQAVKEVADESVGFTIFSPPFSNLYIYSDSLADMGNSASDLEFFEHFGYLVPELYRITVPGRLCAVHCKDLPLYFNRDNAAGLKDFPGDIIRCFESYGWTFHSRVTIWKDPVIEMQRTKNNGLLHKTLCRDSSQVRQGMADYLIVFRKVVGSLMSAKPVTRMPPPDFAGDEKAWRRSHCFTSYVGSQEPVRMSNYCVGGQPDAKSYQHRHCSQSHDGLSFTITHEDGESETITAEEMARRNDTGFGLEVWQRYASPVWFDIRQTAVLNYRSSRGENDERHICPLQLDVIARSVDLWSNKGDVVFSPFAGIGSEGYQSLLLGRKFIGVELKESYWKTAIANLKVAEAKAREVDRPLLAMAEELGPCEDMEDLCS